MTSKPIIVLCLGNEVLSDDRFGFEVFQSLLQEGITDTKVEILFAATAGFRLIDLLNNRKRALIVDTIVTGKHPPGTIHFFSAGSLTPSRHLTTSHQISLPTALKFGTLLGADMPSNVDVLAVEAEDVTTLAEKLTPAIQAAVKSAVLQIRDWIGNK